MKFESRDEFYRNYVEDSIKKESLSVGELIELLCKYPKDMKIVTTWESTTNALRKEDIYISKDGNFLYIDADYGSYKEYFARDPQENEEW